MQINPEGYQILVLSFSKKAWKDIVLLISIVLTAVLSGYIQLLWLPHITGTPSRYNPSLGIPSPNFAASVMLATGRGFVVPEDGDHAEAWYPESAALSKFLLQEIQTLSPEQISDDSCSRTPWGDWEYRHRYLIYAVGGLWRLFGISWNVVIAFRITMYGFIMAMVYGLMRLGMGRFWSTVVTGFLLDQIWRTYRGPAA